MICLDASVAVKWLFEEELSENAFALVRGTLARREAVVAPALLPFEVTNAVMRNARRVGVPLDTAEAMLGLLDNYGIELRQVTGIHVLALRRSLGLGLGAAYDAHYVVLAEELGVPLWTADRRLYNAFAPTSAAVRWLGDFSG